MVIAYIDQLFCLFLNRALTDFFLIVLKQTTRDKLVFTYTLRVDVQKINCFLMIVCSINAEGLLHIMNASENRHPWVTKIYPSSQYNSEGVRNLILLGNTAPFIVFTPSTVQGMKMNVMCDPMPLLPLCFCCFRSRCQIKRQIKCLF